MEIERSKTSKNSKRAQAAHDNVQVAPIASCMQSRRSERIRDQRSQQDERKKRTVFSTEPILPTERTYYEKCERYWHITRMPIISVSDDMFNDDITPTLVLLKFVINKNHNQFDVEEFLNETCNILGISVDDTDINKIQIGSVVLETEIFKQSNATTKKIKVKALYNSLTDKVREELGSLKIIFMCMGDINSWNEKQKFRDEISILVQWNRIYDLGHTYWKGALNDGRNRGNQSYYCPVGWKRYSFSLTDDFDKKFNGWCVCYHGTKFRYGLSILLSGLAPAKVPEHGEGIYASPSIIYTSHPRYSEVKEISSANETEFFKEGRYAQFVLQCRVHPNNIKKIVCGTLKTSSPTIDPHIDNGVLEWVIDTKDNSLVDFHDPNSTIVCTGLMVRVTDNHPGLLPESEWWFTSHLCGKKGNSHCFLGIEFEDLKKQKSDGIQCSIIYK